MRHDDKHGHTDYDPIPDTGKLYETRDVVLSALAKWITFLFVFVGATAFTTWIIYKVFVPNGEEASQFPLPRVRQLPPSPRLQANAVQDIKDYREAEATAISSYGRDPRTGAIHIPIERAMALTLPELPTRAGADAIDFSKTTAPNTPSHFDGQAPAGAAPSPPLRILQGTNTPNMQSGQGAMPTPSAPGSGGLPNPNSSGTTGN